MALFYVAHGCPNCAGEEEDQRLVQGLPCARCLPEKEGEVCKVLARLGTLKNLAPYCKVQEYLYQAEGLFKKALGFLPTPLQRSWLKRLFFRESFAIVAPTGTGKTTFGLMATLLNEGRVLILVPTKLLVRQLEERLQDLVSRAGLSREILAYQGRKEDKKLWEAKTFDILVVTTAFFYRHHQELASLDFKLVFVDDIDSFLKRSSQVDRLFLLLGFSQEEVQLALKPSKKEEDFWRLEEIRKRHQGERVLLLSSATLKPRTNRVLLFRYLLGFEVHRAVSTMRNVIDATTLELPWDTLLEEAGRLIDELGPGGLVFVSSVYGREAVETTTAYLRSRGLKVLSYLECTPTKLMTEMEKGQFHVAVGLAHSTNPLVRGIDLPFILRYALFLGVPRHVIPVRVSLAPAKLSQILAAIVPVLPEEERQEALIHLQYLKRYLNLREESLDRYPRLKERLEKIRTFIEEKFADPAFLQRIEGSKDLALEHNPQGLFLVLGDTTTYLQASGRVSRLTMYGLLPGLSIVLNDHAKSLHSLERRLRFMLGEEFSFRSLQELDIKAISQELTAARKGRQGLAEKEFFKTSLVVVESPHKAKTIASFWGRPTSRRVGDCVVYEIPGEDRLLLVTASLGHVFNLSRQKGFFGVYDTPKGLIPLFDTIKVCVPTGEQLVDIEEVQRRCPQGPVRDKQSLLDGLRRLAFETDEIFIGSDPDAEGEKIAYDLLVSLRPFNKKISRLEFHEVTSRAFKEALKVPQDFNLDRVKAQLTRRVVDRWVGFVLSRRLWAAFGRRRLSAGRVQSPVLGWVIARAEEARQKKALLTFKLGSQTFRLSLEEVALAQKLKNEWARLAWKYVSRREEERFPFPPYTTDTILQDAHRILGLSTRQTMSLLQELFESGLITYHRTDSSRVSEAGRYQVAKPYIVEHFGEDFFQPRGWGEGGAHEAIRPTRPRSRQDLEGLLAAGFFSLTNERQALRLYDLVFRRFMASQMRPCQVEVSTVLFSLPSYHWQEDLVTRVLEHGFDLLWTTFSVVKITPGDTPQEVSLRLVPKVELFTEGSLVQEMKNKGLGRPSTYAEIVSTLIERGYVRVLKGGRLYPTKLGQKVYEYLRKRFPKQVDEALTRALEEAMDEIEAGKLDYQEVLRRTYRQMQAILDTPT